jgi:CTP-dependent riboflavin kinase
MSEPKLVQVYSTYGELQAQVIRSKLEASGIRSIFQNDALGTMGFVADGLGEFKIFVAEQDEQAAREILGDDQAAQDDAQDVA